MEVRDNETELVGLLRAGEFDRAATLAVEQYGAEIYGFLVNHFVDESNAAEVFSQLGEDLWRGLPSFAFRCSIRTWLYVLARHAMSRFRRSPWNHRDRRAGDSQIGDVLDRVRTQTDRWLRTDVKDRWRALREGLDPDDRSLLVLRIDRDLPWEDVARITLETDEVDDAALARETARLRKRFQLLKDELRDRAIKTGLVEDR